VKVFSIKKRSLKIQIPPQYPTKIAQQPTTGQSDRQATYSKLLSLLFTLAPLPYFGYRGDKGQRDGKKTKNGSNKKIVLSD